MAKFKVEWTKAYAIRGSIELEGDSADLVMDLVPALIESWGGDFVRNRSLDDITITPVPIEVIHVPICNTVIHLDTDGGGGSIQSDIGDDTIESLLLAHACAGIDVREPAYLEGIETALQAIANNDSDWDENSDE